LGSSTYELGEDVIFMAFHGLDHGEICIRTYRLETVAERL